MKARIIDTVECSHCKGIGTILLSGVYADTLKLLRTHTSGSQAMIHGAALARIAGCNPTAMNNRLTYLATHGFASEVPCGRKKLYAANR